MKRRILFAGVVLLILVGLFILVKFVSTIVAPKGAGGLQITSNIKAQVFLNNKSIGTAPLCFCTEKKTIPSGSYNLKLVPLDKSLPPYYVKLTINPNVLTAVDRTFLPGALASSYLLTLEKINDTNPQLFISSVPDGSLVSIDGESQGITPLNIKSITSSEHEIEIEKPGFAKKTVRIRTVPNYKLVLNTILGTIGDESSTDQTASPSATLSPIPTVSPTPSGPTVLINDTPTGFLRVRATPSTNGTEIGQVKPGEIYPLVDENSSWFEIKLTDGSEGWVSQQYAAKQ